LNKICLSKEELLQKVSFTQQWAAKADKTKENLAEEDIPEPYQKYCTVFSEEEAKQLPPFKVEDMAIILKEDALEQLDCKVYPLFQKVLKVLRKALDKDVKKGYI
jgi:hypothetical protein